MSTNCTDDVRHVATLRSAKTGTNMRGSGNGGNEKVNEAGGFSLCRLRPATELKALTGLLLDDGKWRGGGRVSHASQRVGNNWTGSNDLQLQAARELAPPKELLYLQYG